MGYGLAALAGAAAVYLFMGGGMPSFQSSYGASGNGYGGYGGGYGGRGPYGYQDIAGYGTQNVPTPSRYQLMTLKNFINIKSPDEEWDWNRVPGSNIIMKPAQLLNPDAPMRVSGADGPTPIPYYLIPENAAPDGTPRNFDPSALGSIQNVTGITLS